VRILLAVPNVLLEYELVFLNAKAILELAIVILLSQELKIFDIFSPFFALTVSNQFL
jgi:hypothetical protein